MSPHIDPAEAGEPSSGNILKDLGFGVSDPIGSSRPTYRLWTNEPRTVLVRLWPDGQMEVATREHAGHTWGPPTYVKETT